MIEPADIFHLEVHEEESDLDEDETEEAEDVLAQPEQQAVAEPLKAPKEETKEEAVESDEPEKGEEPEPPRWHTWLVYATSFVSLCVVIAVCIVVTDARRRRGGGDDDAAASAIDDFTSPWLSGAGGLDVSVGPPRDAEPDRRDPTPAPSSAAAVADDDDDDSSAGSSSSSSEAPTSSCETAAPHACGAPASRDRAWCGDDCRCAPLYGAEESSCACGREATWAETLDGSRFPRRRCACEPCGGQTHVPAGATAGGPACFVDVDPATNPELEAANFFSLGAGVFVNPCSAPSGTLCFADNATLLDACLSPCRGPAGDGRALFLLGDSHAASWVAGVTAAVAPRFGVVQATCGYGCGLNSVGFVEAYLDNDPADLWWARTDVCADFAAKLLAAIRERARAGDVVATITAHYKFEFAGGHDETFLRDLRATVRGAGATLLLLGDGPYLSDHGFNCKTPETEGRCDATRADARPPGFDAAEAFYEELARDEGTLFFPVFDLLCDGGRCRARIPGTSTVAVTDKGHWTTAASLYLAPFLHCFLVDAGVLPAEDDVERAGGCR